MILPADREECSPKPRISSLTPKGRSGRMSTFTFINPDQTKIGYEVSFNKYFYQHKPLRSLEEVTCDILALEAETEGLLKKLVSFGKVR
jgi:hypothetical protein